ncbi:MAG: hypothetical protein JST54_01875 [Deltaproteobacteria bacterium]|nr:hypothetical protein [Deltaproteobacteria bacterium]
MAEQRGAWQHIEVTHEGTSYSGSFRIEANLVEVVYLEGGGLSTAFDGVSPEPAAKGLLVELVRRHLARYGRRS